MARDEGKAGEHGGIGTPATRAAMLATLQKRGFYTVEKKKLIPTPLGLEFIAALPPIASTPDMTALWHEQQQMIQAGELTVDAFLDELERFIGEQVKQVDLGAVQSVSVDTQAINARCPMCGEALFASAKVVKCKACTFRLWPQIAGKTLTTTQIETLLTKGKTRVIKGFKSKAGKAFDAPLQLNVEVLLWQSNPRGVEINSTEKSDIEVNMLVFNVTEMAAKHLCRRYKKGVDNAFFNVPTSSIEEDVQSQSGHSREQIHFVVDVIK
uniref:DNA topoisomerase n=1 Tax=Glossina pallidipes TaxID=7398 RepID=A0A1A9Z2B8_GLOPL